MELERHIFYITLHCFISFPQGYCQTVNVQEMKYVRAGKEDYLSFMVESAKS